MSKGKNQTASRPVPDTPAGSTTNGGCIYLETRVGVCEPYACVVVVYYLYVVVFPFRPGSFEATDRQVCIGN